MKAKRILVTGGTGSFGKKVVASLLQEGVEEVRILSRDEGKQDLMRGRMADPRLKFHIGDVRDRDSVERVARGVDAIFHAAALKQVPSCEFFPIEAVRTNVLGSENVVRAAMNHKVKSVVCLSTDKAVAPVNAMGMSKALMEKVARAAARELGQDADTTIACVRYGNVLYSRGSVVPLFIDQIKRGKPITVTEPTMTRFLMPLEDSVALVKFAIEHANQGDLFVHKAKASTIADLVEAVKQIFDVPDHPVDVIGWRHGEKLYETLASAQELLDSEDMGDYYRLRLDDRDLNYASFFSEGDEDRAEREEFNSHNCDRLDVEGTKQLLLSLPEVREEVEAWQAR
ncbi:polysaccharide biosynthesis protein [Sphingomicrobium sediminis]|uniref:UDP-glucose 4-epimerase n=1 Tax=Sphingomicrobium sediminis TaxID=2950949 RepID=A0A9X2EJ99_9SPHN|nr:polysaccharide biosynthesis protein [Sphingomicrobium sediminis]MCM8556639.1 polysaccharide biosynthesis protein [Sphingomicrobium sediminis]